jgi:hypothetical protein
MDSPDSRCITHPVHPDEWSKILRALGVDAESHHREPENGARRRRTASEISETNQNLLLSVKEVNGLCVLRPKRETLTELNKALEKLRWDGCFPNGQVYKDKEGRFRYIKLSPRALQVTDDTLKKVFPAEDRERVSNLLLTGPSPDEPPRGSGGGADALEPYVVIWTAAEFDSRRKLFGPKDLTKRERDLLETVLGDVVPKPTADEPGLVVVISRANTNKSLARRLMANLSKSGIVGESTVVVKREPPTSDDHHLIQSSLATVIWVDEGLTDFNLVLLAADPPPERLFLLADKAHGPSVGRLHALADWLKLGPTHHHLIELSKDGSPKKDALEAVAEQVRRVVERGREELKVLEESKRIWHQAKRDVERMLDGTTLVVDPEILEEAVLRPFKQRVARVMRGRIASGSDSQKDFVRVATPLYNRAKNIYALHTDRHSTFWSHPAFDEETKKRFLTICPTVRLFLYSSSEKLFSDLSHQDHDVLNYQSAHYAANAHSDSGAVKLLVADLHGFEQAFGPVNRDVAFIQLESEKWYRFTLNEHDFEAEELREATIDDDSLHRLLPQLGIKVRPGYTANFPADRANGMAFEYLCWERGFEKDSHFEQYVNDIFRYNTETSAHRVLTFQNDGPIETQIPAAKFKSIVLTVHHALKSRLDDFRKKFGLKSIEHGSLMVRSPEGRGGKLPPTCQDESRHILILHFDADQGLRKFSISQELEEIRNELYREILEARSPSDLGEEEVRNLAKAMKLVGNRYLTIHDYTARHDDKEWFRKLKHVADRHTTSRVPGEVERARH